MMPPVGKSGPLQVLHQALDVDLRVVDEGHDRVDRLAQVVRRDVRGHADRDARRAVDQQVREARRQDVRLLARLVVVRAELDGVRVDVAEHLRGEPRQARLGVPHRGRSVVVDRAEVALRVDQRVAHREVLAEPDQGVVDRRVAVGVVVPHDAADDVRALAVRAPGLEPGVVHRVEDAAVDRLEPVAHVRQRAAHDHAHGVVEVGGAHLLLEPARLDVSACQLIDAHLLHVQVRDFAGVVLDELPPWLDGCRPSASRRSGRRRSRRRS